MSESNGNLFFDLDPHTGQYTPTTYESMQASMMGSHPVQEDVPGDIQRLLLTAIDYFALANEQANAGRMHLYDRLTNDAFVKAVLALEMALRRRLGRGNRVRLEELISAGIAGGLLPAANGLEEIWTELRQNRNAITHGDPDLSSYGPSTGRFIGVVIDTLNAMYANMTADSTSANTGLPSEEND